MERGKESDSKDNSKEMPGALILAELRAHLNFDTNVNDFPI